ncbi:hypothetical protein MC885_005010 [Smutsia gigantea]|nr:hypothetical protein MC885_005010 [Smutsia gigantea]
MDESDTTLSGLACFLLFRPLLTEVFPGFYRFPVSNIHSTHTGTSPKSLASAVSETRREKVLQNVSTDNCSETNGNKTLHWPSLLLKIFSHKNSSFQALATYKKKKNGPNIFWLPNSPRFSQEAGISVRWEMGLFYSTGEECGHLSLPVRAQELSNGEIHLIGFLEPWIFLN